MTSDSLRIVKAESVEVAPGFSVYRAMPLRGFRGLDPFILLDHFGPLRVQPDTLHGVPAHPHRGFVAVTYMLSGRMHHKDSLGNDIMVCDGDVNWISAAYGLQHSEDPEPEFVDGVAELHGFQIWVNLPAKHKLSQPLVQHSSSSDLPIVETEHSRLKVLAGRYADLQSPIRTLSPVQLMHLSLDSGAEFSLEHTEGFEYGIYLAQGSCRIGEHGEHVGERELVSLPNTANTTHIVHSSERAAELIIMGGQALNEKVFAHGPFVMNSFEEIQDAIRDYERGEMGFL